MTDAREHSGPPAAFEMLAAALLLNTGAVLAPPMLPGFTLCVTGLILMAVVVLAPLVALQCWSRSQQRSWRCPSARPLHPPGTTLKPAHRPPETPLTSGFPLVTR